MKVRITILDFEAKKTKAGDGEYGVAQCVVHDERITAGPFAIFAEFWQQVKGSLKKGDYMADIRLQPSGFRMEALIQDLQPVKADKPVAA